MVQRIQFAVVTLVWSFMSTTVQAELETATEATPGSVPSEAITIDAGPQGSEVEVVSANGSITRAKCPHTCADRNIPKGSCKEWRSKMYPDVCYVEDTSKPSHAIK